MKGPQDSTRRLPSLRELRKPSLRIGTMSWVCAQPRTASLLWRAKAVVAGIRPDKWAWLAGHLLVAPPWGTGQPPSLDALHRGQRVWKIQVPASSPSSAVCPWERNACSLNVWVQILQLWHESLGPESRPQDLMPWDSMVLSYGMPYVGFLETLSVIRAPHSSVHHPCGRHPGHLPALSLESPTAVASKWTCRSLFCPPQLLLSRVISFKSHLPLHSLSPIFSLSLWCPLALKIWLSFASLIPPPTSSRETISIQLHNHLSFPDCPPSHLHAPTFSPQWSAPHIPYPLLPHSRHLNGSHAPPSNLYANVTSSMKSSLIMIFKIASISQRFPSPLFCCLCPTARNIQHIKQFTYGLYFFLSSPNRR